MGTELQVLWVDDDSRKLRVVQDLFNGLSVELVHASSIEDAFERLGARTYIPVLLLDAILAPPKDSKLVKLLMSSPQSTVSHWEAETPISSGEDPEKPLEWIYQNSYENLERGGKLFQDLCTMKGVSFGKIIIISYVKEEVLKDIGYKFDAYISKLDLPDYLGFLQREIESVLEGAPAG